MEGKQREVDLHYETGRYVGHGMPPCMYCENLIDIGGLNLEGWTCKAFPRGIDKKILSRYVSHENPLPDDNGFQYAPETFKDRSGKYIITWDGGIEEVNE
jgi:hypothetical protein